MEKGLVLGITIVLIKAVLILNVVAALRFIHSYRSWLTIISNEGNIQIIECPINDIDRNNLLSLALCVVQITNKDHFIYVEIEVFSLEMKLISCTDIQIPINSLNRPQASDFIV